MIAAKNSALKGFWNERMKTERAFASAIKHLCQANLLDEYLGLKGYEGQQTTHPKGPDAPDNLWKPVPGDHGAHGMFNPPSANSSKELWIAKNRPWLGAVAAGVAVMGVTMMLNGNRKHKLLSS